MKQFAGFPAKMQFTPIPNLFLSALLPQINDVAELKVTLHIFAALYQKKGSPRFITYRELLGNVGLMKSLKGSAESPDEALRGALEKASQRGTILHTVLDRGGTPEGAYFLNTEANRQVVVKIQNGEFHLGGLKFKGQPYVEAEEPPDIFALYEENIGMLTPMIAEELREAEKLYPGAWIRDAIKEAVNQNKRKWNYISAILERWSLEGRSDGTHRRDFKKEDPDKYIKQKYGHMFRR